MTASTVPLLRELVFGSDSLPENSKFIFKHSGDALPDITPDT